MTKGSAGMSWATLLLASAALCAQGPPPHRPPPGGGHEMGRMMGGPGVPGSRGEGFSEISLVTGAPYSAVQTIQSQQTLANGIQIQNQQQNKVYRDSQGRTRVESTRGTSESEVARTLISIYDPAAGTMVRLNPQTQTAVRNMMPRFGPGPERRPGPGSRPPFGSPGPAGELQTVDLGTKTINGLTATGTRTTVTIPVGAIGNNQPIPVVRETWVSTDLKVPVLITSSDPRFGTSTMQLTNVVRSEPAASLFAVPSSYQLMVEPGPGGPHGPPPSRGPDHPR